MEVNNNDKNNSNKVETIKKQSYKWSKANVDNARKKISKLIFQQERQASINIKLDDLSIFINDEIQRRGIQRGFVNIQEDFNKNILNIEKIKNLNQYQALCPITIIDKMNYNIVVL